MSGKTVRPKKEHQLRINQLLADTGYSSGEALKYCEENKIEAYIPNLGRYKPEREGFIYNKDLDRYECQRGNKAILSLRYAKLKNGSYYVNRYCNSCLLLEECCGNKTKYKKIDDSIHKEYYNRMHKKLTERKSYAQRLYRMRCSTVEPVLGTLINFMNMRRVNARGLDLASKHVIMAALAYNLKKYLKYTGNISKNANENALIIPVPVEGLFSVSFFLLLILFGLFPASF